MARASFLVALGALTTLSTVAPALAQSNQGLGTATDANGVATTGPNGTSANAMLNADHNTTAKVTADHQLRSSKMIGASIYDEKNNVIGSVDDILLSSNEHGPNVVLSVGGVLGIGSKLVEVPYAHLKINNEGRIVLPGVTKESLKAMSSYRYSGDA